MLVLKLRSSHVRDKLTRFFAANAIYFPSKHDLQDIICTKIMRAIKGGAAMYYVAVDECAANKVIGFAGCQIEHCATKAGTPAITITDLFALPEYDGAKELLLRHIVRSAITEDAHVLRVLAPIGDQQFFTSNLFHVPVSHCIMERDLPSKRFKRLREPREMD